MTSLAVIFLLLFIAVPWRPPVQQPPMSQSVSETDISGTPTPVASVLSEWLRPVGLAPEQLDASELMVVMPEALLNFEFGKSTLPPAALQYVAEVMPIYAGAVCGEHDVGRRARSVGRGRVSMEVDERTVDRGSGAGDGHAE